MFIINFIRKIVKNIVLEDDYENNDEGFTCKMQDMEN